MKKKKQKVDTKQVIVKLISQNQTEQIRTVGHFRDSIYANLDISRTLEFYAKRYVYQIDDFFSVNSNTIITDVGAGYGWLSMAFALLTDARIIAIDPDEPRLQAGKKIAQILGVDPKISWRTGSLGNLPLNSNESDVTYCIEVLEHVGRDPVVLHDLCRITKKIIILTTPNLWFPIVAHDSGLPFCHWLPIPIRRYYAKFFNREQIEHFNLFWSPYKLIKNMKDFKHISKFLHYSSYSRYLDTFPFYLPYHRGKGKKVDNPSTTKKLFYRLISFFGRYSIFLTPSLASVFIREES